jgi:hypothetical protein
MENKARHLDICACVAKRRKNLIFTGQSAAAIYGIPWLGAYEMRPHCFSGKPKGADFIRWYHGKYDPQARMLGGYIVVGPIQTIFDMAKYHSPESLLVSINHCLYHQLFTKEAFAAELEKRHGMRHRDLLRRLLRFANPKCESPLETIAWVALYRAKLALPEQQIDFFDSHQFVGCVDMYWEIRGKKIILELDGWSKYKEGDDFKREKRREDHLRKLCDVCIRAEWRDVRSGALVQMLVENGIPFRRNFVGTFPEKEPTKK